MCTTYIQKIERVTFNAVYKKSVDCILKDVPCKSTTEFFRIKHMKECFMVEVKNEKEKY